MSYSKFVWKLGERLQTLDGLRSQLTTVQDELDRLRTLEMELGALQEETK